MNKVLVGDKRFTINYSIKSLLEIEDSLGIELDTLIFESDIDTNIQLIVMYHGLQGLSFEDLASWYTSLTVVDRMTVDIQVNSVLLESLGIGGEVSADTNSTENTEQKSFKENMEKLCYFTVIHTGITITEFYNSTPKFIYELCDNYYKGLEFKMQMDTISAVNAFGLTHDKKFKPINPFDNESNSTHKKVDLDKKQADLDFLLKVGDAHEYNNREES